MPPPKSNARSETHPAEFGFTVLARHVIAAPVLLNGHVALGAILCVRVEPVGGLRIVGALLEPHLH